MNPAPQDSVVAHHIKGIQPVLTVLKSLGIDGDACLEGTGITMESLIGPEARITLEQEFQFYRNILGNSADPLIGLKLGEIFRPEAYGLVGYAILSAATLRDSLQMTMEFGALTFTHFKVTLEEYEDSAAIVFSPQYPVPADLLQIYSDRDVQAAVTASTHMQEIQLKANFVYLMHDDLTHLTEYQEYFECPVILGHHRNELHFDKTLLEVSLPKSDIKTSQYCREQCQKLLDSLTEKGSLIESVRQLLISSPGEFPSIEVVAEQLGYSVRSLRRHLDNEGSSYRQLLNEIRFQLAKEYLETHMPIEQISEFLGYTEPGNFSHAFKRWQGCSPKEYRRSRTA